MKYYCEEKEDVLSSVNSRDGGLTSEEAEKRLAENGKNKLAEPEKTSLFRRFFQYGIKQHGITAVIMMVLMNVTGIIATDIVVKEK